MSRIDKAFRPLPPPARPGTPRAVLTPCCDGCSLRPVCLPEAAASPALSRAARGLFTARDYA